MKNKHKKSLWNTLTRFSLIIGIIVAILSGVVYCTNIYDRFSGNVSQASQQISSNNSIVQIQSGTNNIQNFVLKERSSKQSTTKTILFFWCLSNLSILIFGYLIIKLFFDFCIKTSKKQRKKNIKYKKL